eukprot:6200880-Pleurochrysis_carterae.AAC.2
MLRPADVLSNCNSTRYSRDVTFYVGKDTHGDLEVNMAVGGIRLVAAVLNEVRSYYNLRGGGPRRRPLRVQDCGYDHRSTGRGGGGVRRVRYHRRRRHGRCARWLGP